MSWVLIFALLVFAAFWWSRFIEIPSDLEERGFSVTEADIRGYYAEIAVLTSPFFVLSLVIWFFRKDKSAIKVLVFITIGAIILSFPVCGFGLLQFAWVE